MANPLSIFKKRQPETMTTKKAAGGNTVSVSSNGTRKVTNKYGVTTTFHNNGLTTSDGLGRKRKQPAEAPKGTPASSTSRSGPTKRYQNKPATSAPKAAPRPISRPDGGGSNAPQKTASQGGGKVGGGGGGGGGGRKLGITDYGTTQNPGPGRRFPNGAKGRAAEKAAGWNVGRNAKMKYGGIVSTDSTMGRYIKRQQGKKRT